jgi:predicted ATPase/DNA-binding SARP family transcriptional activator
VRYGILGPLTVWRDDRQLEIGGPRVRVLLALLLLDPGRVVPAGRLIEGLWGLEPPAGAANALQTLVSRVRTALAPERPVESRAGGYVLLAEPDQVDARRFERLLEEGKHALTGAQPRRAGELLRSSLALWRGDPLPELAETGAAQAEVARLTQLRLAAIEHRIEADLAGGPDTGLVAELEALIAEHPLHERFRGLFIRTLYAQGRQADALNAYEQTRRLLRDELGIDPSPELQKIHLAILKRDPGLDPGAAPAPTSNLPAQLTSFVGREQDLRRVAELLDGNRLVTLVGPGGAGKTRLAIELGGQLLRDFSDGVRMVALAPVSEPDEVPRAVLDALGVREVTLLGTRAAPAPGAVGPVERLVEALSGKRMLLVLDNCEHVIESSARLADVVLAGCPGVRVLATSREPLGVVGEMLWQIPSLRLPPATVTLEDALDYASIRLFVDRATAVQPGFQLDERHLPAVAEVCRRLDGMPLAIELAAARLRSLSVEQVAERLGDRFGLLTGGSRVALPRHQTLRAVVDWSWDLLDAGERILLPRLAVFAGGATIESAERVCAGPDLEPAAVLDLLAGLVDKSLLEAQPAGGGMRYRMLETVRAYGQERLLQAGEADAVRSRHAEFFCELAERAEPMLRGAEQLRWLDRLAAEHDNLLAALRWAVDAGEGSLALRLVVALQSYWNLRGTRTEGRTWLPLVLDMAAEVPPEIMGVARAHEVGIWMERGDMRRAQAARDQARALFDASEKLPHHMLVLVEVWTALIAGFPQEAEEALDRWRQDPRLNRWTQALVDWMTGQLEMLKMSRDTARRSFERAAAGFRGVGDRWGLAQVLTAQAELAEARGDYPRAEAALQEALELARLLGSRMDEPMILIRLGTVRGEAGDLEASRASFEQGMRLAREVGANEILASGSYYQALLARHRGQLEEAHSMLDLATRVPVEPGAVLPFRSMIEIALGYVHELEGDLPAAVAAHRRAIAQLLRIPIVPTWIGVMLSAPALGLAAVAVRTGQAERAAVLVGASIARRYPVLVGPLERPDIERVEGAVERAIGDPDRCRELIERGKAMTQDELLAYVEEGPWPAPEGERAEGRG